MSRSNYRLLNSTATVALLVLAVHSCAISVVAAPATAFASSSSDGSAFDAQPEPDDRPLPEEVGDNLQGSFQRLLSSGSRVLPAVAAALIALGGFWALAVLVRKIVRRAARYVRDPTIKYLLVQVSYYSIWTLGAIVVLDVAGVRPESVITALGLTGVAAGFALRE